MLSCQRTCAEDKNFKGILNVMHPSNVYTGLSSHYLVTVPYDFLLAIDTVSFIRLSHVLFTKQYSTVFSNRTSFYKGM